MGLFADVLVGAIVSRGQPVLVVDTARAAVAAAAAVRSAAMLRVHACRVQRCGRTVRAPTDADGVVRKFTRIPIR